MMTEVVGELGLGRVTWEVWEGWEHGKLRWKLRCPSHEGHVRFRVSGLATLVYIDRKSVV